MSWSLIREFRPWERKGGKLRRRGDKLVSCMWTHHHQRIASQAVAYVLHMERSWALVNAKPALSPVSLIICCVHDDVDWHKKKILCPNLTIRKVKRNVRLKFIFNTKYCQEHSGFKLLSKLVVSRTIKKQYNYWLQLRTKCYLPVIDLIETACDGL